MSAHSPLAKASAWFRFSTGGTRLSTLLPIFTTAGLLAVTGCLSEEPDVSSTSQAATVSTYVGSGCSTAVVLGLSKQIADEIACESSTLLTRFDPSNTLVLTSNAVLPYLSSGAKNALVSVSATRTVQINSAFRTVAQQYLLYRWYQQGRCGISAAATPGRSNHETGRALDVSNYSSLVSAMAAKGWSHSVPGDPVHFDHTASPDSRGKDVAAFQRLWNRNNPNDKITVDGSYGPATEARLKQAPATGFALGPTCGTVNFAADVVAVDGPDRVQPQTRATYRLTLVNNTDREWPGSAVLRLKSAASSTLHDASWMSANQLTELGSAIPPGGTGTLTFDVTTPVVTEETPVFEQLAIDDGGEQLGTVHLALTVVPGMEEETSSDGDEYDQEITGGCSAGTGTGSPLILLALAGLFARRRRRTI